MDLNQLYKNQQIALMNADATTCPSARVAHAARATLYGDHITAWRAASVAASGVFAGEVTAI